MKLPVVLAVLIGILVLACSTAAPAPAEPTPNTDATVEVEPTPDIDATVKAKLAQERAVDATVEARLAEERAFLPTSIPSPTSAAVPQQTNSPALIATPTSVPTPFQWPSPPTGQRELMLSSTSGPVGDEVTAIGRGFTTTGYAVIWIDSNDNGLIDIDDGEHVIAENIKALEREFSQTFTIDSNFQGISSINAMGGDGMAVDTAMNPTFTVPGTSVTPGPAPTAVSTPTAVPTPTPRPIPTPTPRPMPTLEPCDDRSAPPQVFVGAVQANGQAAPDGTEVSAWVDDVEVARTYASGGEFNILIDVCREGSKRLSGARVSFKIGGKWAAESGVLQLGGGDVLSLTQTTGIATPTPVPTPTPTIIPTPTPVPLPLLEVFGMAHVMRFSGD